MRPQRQLDERFADWVDGRLTPRDLARLEAEFEVNRELRQKAEAYRASVELLRRALAEPEPAVNLADRVLARIEVRPRPKLGTLPFLASLTAAAAVILMFFVLNGLQPAGDPDSLETAKRDADESAAAGIKGHDELEADGDRLDAIGEAVRTAGPPASEPPAELQARVENQVSAGKVAAGADEVLRQRAERNAGDKEEPARPPLDPLEKAGEVADDRALNEIEAWLREVVGEAPARSNFGAGLPSVPEDRPQPSPARPSTAPVTAGMTPIVVINLPDGQDLDGTLPSGGASAGGRAAQPGARTRRVDPPSVAGTRSEEAVNRELKDQKLQEVIDRSQLPMSNVLPAEVDEIDPGDLPVLQGAVGFDAKQQGRGFLVRGERQQVAGFLRQMSDWGRARGGGVAVTQIAETAVQQAQAPAGGQLERISQLASGSAGEIEIVLLFQTGRKDR